MAGKHIENILIKINNLNEDIIQIIIYDYLYPKKQYLQDIIEIQKLYQILFIDQMNYYYYNYNYLLEKIYYISNISEYACYHLDAVCYTYNIYEVLKKKKYKNRNINNDFDNEYDNDNENDKEEYLVKSKYKELKQNFIRNLTI